MSSHKIARLGVLLNFACMMFLLSHNAAAVTGGDPNFAGTHFTGSGKCAECHNNLRDTQGKDISIITAWKGSMMANSTRDPYWKAKVASELKRAPQLASVINDKCSRCHAPMANETATRDGGVKEILGSGFLNPLNKYFNHAMDGVSCTVCHQIENDGNLGTSLGNSGHYTIAKRTNSVDRPAYGQYADVLTGPMRMKVKFTPQLGTHTSTSDMCGTCHDLKTPFIDSTGKVVSNSSTEHPEQMPNTEWANSDYRTGGSKQQNCQGCHMPKVAGAVKIASKPGELTARQGFGTHELIGANTVMLDILNKNRTALGVLDTATDLTADITRTRNFLKTAATIEVVSASVASGVLQAQVRVTNKTGHKLPTAYPSRRAYIHFVVKNSAGQVVFESGRLNTNGSIVGVAVDSDPTTYEPHYQTITAADQVQVYEPIMADTDGNVTHSLLRGSRYLKDNRLTPSGFNKLTVPEDVAVKGEAAQDADFNNGSDTVIYQIPVASTTGLTITAELNYQTLSYGHLQDLFRDVSLPEVSTFKTMFDSRGILMENLATATRTAN